MSNLTSSLSIRLNDDVSGPAARAAGALRGLGSSGDALKKLAASSPEAAKLIKQLEQLRDAAGKIQAFRDASRGLGEAGAGFRAARQDVAQLTAELAKAKAKADALKGVRTGPNNPNAETDRLAAAASVRKLERDLRQANGTLTASKAAFLDQGKAVRAAQADLTAAVGPVRNLRAAEAGIAAATKTANDALSRQPALMEAAVRKSERLASAGRDLARGMSEVGRRQEAVISSSRRMASGMSGAGRVAAHARVAELEAAALSREERHVQRLANRREAVGVLAGAGAVKAAAGGRRLATDAITSVAEFDIETRKQKVYTDIGDDDQAKLQTQAKKIGQETQFSNIDVVKAQTASMQGLPAGFSPKLKAEVAGGIVENVRDYATLMNTDLKDGAETIRSYLQASGKDISSKEKALFEAEKATNQIVKMAKLGGMNGEDAAQFVKFAAAPGAASGLSTDSMLSLGALARRGGLRGDEAGVFMRATAGKIVSPTNKGVAALNAAGINHSDYVKMPDKLSTDALEGQFKTSTGKSFTPEVREKVEAINSDKSITADRGNYTKAIVDALGPILGKNKDGTVRASDAKVAAKATGDFHKLSAQSVDAEGLLDAAMSKKMTLAQLNAWLTDKHGGKGAITGQQWDEFKASREQIKTAGDDPSTNARAKANFVNAGVGGSWENMKGSFENFTLQLGAANAGLIKMTADGIGSAVDGFSSLSTTQQQAATAVGGVAALAGGTWGALKLAGALLGHGGGAALTGSAVALDASAAALTAAAARLGVSGAAGAAATAAAAAPAAAAGSALAVGGVAAGVLLGGLTASVLATEAVKNPDFAKPYLGEEGSEHGGMLGADPAGYGLGAAIVHADKLPGAMALRASETQAALRRDAAREAERLKGIRASAAATDVGSGRHGFGLDGARAAETAAPRKAMAPAIGAIAADPRSDPMGALAAEPVEFGRSPVDASAVQAATAALAAYKAELAGVEQQLTGLQASGEGAFSPELPGLEARKAALEGMVDGAKAKLQELGATSIAPQVDTSNLDAIGPKSDEATAKLNAINAVAVSPNVSTGSLDALIAKANQAAAALTRLASMAGSANASIASVNRTASAGGGAGSTGKVRSALSDNHTAG